MALRRELDASHTLRVDSRGAWSLPTSRTERTPARYLNTVVGSQTLWSIAETPMVVTRTSRVPALNSIHPKEISSI